MCRDVTMALAVNRKDRIPNCRWPYWASQPKGSAAWDSSLKQPKNRSSGVTVEPLSAT